MSGADSGRRLSASERDARILRELRLNAAIRVGDLAERLDVTTETIRRDLKRLTGAGKLHRLYGGATLPPTSPEPAIAERAARQVAERLRIGRAATALVRPGDAVLIDAGSTTTLFARQLAAAGVPDLTVVTNGFDVATALAHAPGIRLMLCPGEFTAREGGVTGAETAAFLARYRATLAVIGASGLLPDGPAEANPDAAAVKRAMLGAASRCVLLADATKFGVAALQVICTWRAISTLVTDAQPSGDLAVALAESGTQLDVAA